MTVAFFDLKSDAFIMSKAGRKKAPSRELWVKLGEALRKVRQKHGLTQEQMAEVLGVHPRMYQRYEKGEVSPDTILPVLEKKFGITEAEIKAMAGIYTYKDLYKALAIAQNAERYHTGGVKEVDYIKIPVITGAGAGEVIENTYVLVERSQIPNTHVKAFKVMGDSMEPKVHDGEIVLIDPYDTDLQDGKIYLFARSNYNDENGLTLRIAKKINNRWYLVPANEKYPIEPLTDSWRIVGRAIKVLHIEARKL